MRQLCLLALSFSALSAAAVTLDVARLPVPSHADREVSGDTAFTFTGLPLTPFPDWLKPDLWTHLLVTVRGVSAANENVSARFLPDGARIIIR